MPTLYVVATPIGNLGDMTPRAIETLQRVGLIAAEDTRVTQKLLAAFAIHTPLTSCHEHNERFKAEQIACRMRDEGIDVAMTSDAGTPCLSDPGAALVREAIRFGFDIVAIPGPTALAAALSISGFDVEEFTFFGFLPRKKAELKRKLLEMAARSKIAVVHESPHRVIDLLACVAEVLPATRVSVSCDLTKKFESTLRGGVYDVLVKLRENPKAEKGEYCLALEWHDAAPPPPSEALLSLEARLFDGMVKGLALPESMDEMIRSGERKNAVYAASLRLKAMLGKGGIGDDRQNG